MFRTGKNSDYLLHWFLKLCVKLKNGEMWELDSMTYGNVITYCTTSSTTSKLYLILIVITNTRTKTIGNVKLTNIGWEKTCFYDSIYWKQVRENLNTV